MSSATIDTALYAILNGDATLGTLVSGVYKGVATQGAAYPFILFQLIRSGDRYTFTQRVSTEHQYQVKCVAEGYSDAIAQTAMARVDALLTDQSLDVTGKTLWVMRRTSEFYFAEGGEFGVMYQHRGGEWKIEVA